MSKLFSSAIIAAAMAMMFTATSCSENSEPEPAPVPDVVDNFQGGVAFVELPGEAGEQVIDLTQLEGSGLIPLCYISDNCVLTPDKRYFFENNPHDFQRVNGGLGISEYMLEKGISDYEDSSDFMLPYSWIEAASFTDDGRNRKLRLKYTANPGYSTREMDLHFNSPKWALVIVSQAPAPKE